MNYRTPTKAMKAQIQCFQKISFQTSVRGEGAVVRVGSNQ